MKIGMMILERRKERKVSLTRARCGAAAPGGAKRRAARIVVDTTTPAKERSMSPSKRKRSVTTQTSTQRTRRSPAHVCLVPPGAPPHGIESMI
jgi:hypothetical protein